MNPEQKRTNETPNFLQSDPTRGSSERQEDGKAEKAARMEQDLPKAGRSRMMRGLLYLGGAYILYRLSRRLLRRGNAKLQKA
jgi:hypothetical protein